MSISDLFKYGIAHGLYTAFATSPVSGLFMQTRSERLAKAGYYKPFTEGGIKAIFEPMGYKAGMADWAAASFVDTDSSFRLPQTVID